MWKGRFGLGLEGIVGTEEPSRQVVSCLHVATRGSAAATVAEGVEWSGADLSS